MPNRYHSGKPVAGRPGLTLAAASRVSDSTA
jgi:hypothetical protein